MAITTETETEFVKVRRDGSMEVQERIVTLDDGQEISRSQPRNYVLAPGQTPPREDPLIDDIRNKGVHTPERVNAFRAKRDARQSR